MKFTFKILFALMLLGLIPTVSHAKDTTDTLKTCGSVSPKKDPDEQADLVDEDKPLNNKKGPKAGAAGPTWIETQPTDSLSNG